MDWETNPQTNHTGREITEEELQELWTTHVQNFEKPNIEIFRGLKPKTKETTINLSSHHLTDPEQSLLSKGLSFALSNSNNNIQSLETDRIANEKRIAIRRFFPTIQGNPNRAFT